MVNGLRLPSLSVAQDYPRYDGLTCVIYSHKKQREPKCIPYCHTAFQNVPPAQVENILSTFTKEQFIGGRAAYTLDDGGYSIIFLGKMILQC